MCLSCIFCLFKIMMILFIGPTLVGLLIPSYKALSPLEIQTLCFPQSLFLKFSYGSTYERVEIMADNSYNFHMVVRFFRSYIS